MSAADAQKEADKITARFEAEKSAKAAQRSSVSEDAKRVAAFCDKNKGVRDNVGNLLCP